MKITECQIVKGKISVPESGWAKAAPIISEFQTAAQKIVDRGFKPAGGIAVTGGRVVAWGWQTFVKCDGDFPRCEYRVIFDERSDGKFERDVRDAIKEGWEPQGGVAVASDGGSPVVAQAFVRGGK